MQIVHADHAQLPPWLRLWSNLDRTAQRALRPFIYLPCLQLGVSGFHNRLRARDEHGDAHCFPVLRWLLGMSTIRADHEP